MSTQLVTSFEVLAQPIAPGVPAIPYVEQGSFLQITNLGSAARPPWRSRTWRKRPMPCPRLAGR
jgi:hypothetical protein